MKENMKNKKEETILRELEKIKEEAINSSGKKYYNISIKQIKKISPTLIFSVFILYYALL